VVIHTDKEGIVIKADTLGSLEALIKLLKEKEIDIKKATIGNIIKKDISDAEANFEKNPLLTVILGFNVKSTVEKTGNVKIITDEVIYKLIENFERWQDDKRRSLEAGEMDMLVKPCKVQIMKGYVFRQSNPAICGVDVLDGTIKVGTPLMKEDGKEITEVKAIQKDQENVDKAERNQQVAVSMGGVTVGRQINEGEILYSAISEHDFRKFKEFKQYLTKEETEIIKEVAKIKRKNNSVWGV
ncbi:MAG: translation initiation factor IF-2, partial [Nanoarchaeota archaeon]